MKNFDIQNLEDSLKRTLNYDKPEHDTKTFVKDVKKIIQLKKNSEILVSNLHTLFMLEANQINKGPKIFKDFEDRMNFKTMGVFDDRILLVMTSKQIMFRFYLYYMADHGLLDINNAKLVTYDLKTEKKAIYSFVYKSVRNGSLFLCICYDDKTLELVPISEEMTFAERSESNILIFNDAHTSSEDRNILINQETGILVSVSKLNIIMVCNIEESIKNFGLDKNKSSINSNLIAVTHKFSCKKADLNQSSIAIGYQDEEEYLAIWTKYHIYIINLSSLTKIFSTGLKDEEKIIDSRGYTLVSPCAVISELFRIHIFSYSPDGKFFIVGFEDIDSNPTLNLYAMKNLELLSCIKIEAPKKTIVSVLFENDGQHIRSASTHDDDDDDNIRRHKIRKNLESFTVDSLFSADKRIKGVEFDPALNRLLVFSEEVGKGVKILKTNDIGYDNSLQLHTKDPDASTCVSFAKFLKQGYFLVLLSNGEISLYKSEDASEIIKLYPQNENKVKSINDNKDATENDNKDGTKNNITKVICAEINQNVIENSKNIENQDKSIIDVNIAWVVKTSPHDKLKLRIIQNIKKEEGKNVTYQKFLESDIDNPENIDKKVLDLKDISCYSCKSGEFVIALLFEHLILFVNKEKESNQLSFPDKEIWKRALRGNKSENAISCRVKNLWIAMSYDFIITADNHKSLNIYSNHTKRLLFKLPNHHSEVITSLKFSDDFNSIISFSEDRSVKILNLRNFEVVWDIQNLHESKILLCHINSLGTIWTAALIRSADKKISYLTTGSSDGKVKFTKLEDQTSWSLNSSYFSTDYSCTKFIDNIIISGLYNPLSFWGYITETKDNILIIPNYWNFLHLLAVYMPNSFKDIPLDFKIYQASFLLDAFNKTPLHYLLEHQAIDEKKINLASINSLVSYMNDWIEGKAAKEKIAVQNVIQSLGNLILNKNFLLNLDPKVACRLLQSMVITPETILGDHEIYSGDVKFRTFENDSIILTKQLANKVHVHSKNGDVINFSVILWKMNYSIYSEDTKSIIEILHSFSEQEYYETKIVTTFIKRLWKHYKYYHYVIFFLYSVMSILFSMTVGSVERRTKAYSSVILIFAGLLLLNEMFRILSKGLRPYFFEIWNLFFCGYFILLFVTLSYMNSESADKESLAWLQAVTVFLGYLTWLTYMRLFAATRGFLRVLKSIIRDIWSFCLLLIIIFVGFALIYSAFNGELNFNQQLLLSYLVIYGPPDLMESSTSDQLFFSISSFILAVILVNLLVTIMSQSHDLLFEKQLLIQEKERLEMIKESYDFVEFFLKLGKKIKYSRINCLKKGPPPVLEDEKKYLFICE